MHAAFQRLGQGVLATFGEDSLLRGSVPCRVNIEHGVQVIGSDDNVMVERSVATIATSVSPKVDDELSHPDGNYRLDAIYQDNGVNKRFILLKLV
jgi:hypothetical protein